MKLPRVGALTAAVVVLAAPAAAQAHISLHPNVIPAGAFATLDIRVPGEQAGAHVVKVDTLFPPGFIAADYQNVPGWTASVINQKLAKPVQSDSGPIDVDVSQIIWIWKGPDGRVDNNQFVQFPLSVAIPTDDAGKTLQFKTLQTYSNGQVVRWIDPSLSADHPSPTVNITAPGGVIEDVAGDEAGPTAGQGSSAHASTPTPVAAKVSVGASKGLGLAALILGALGVLVGLAALVATRGARATGRGNG